LRIDLAHIGEEFPQVCSRLELGSVELGRKNPSPEVLKRTDLTATQIERVKVLYRDDYEYMQNRPQIL
jgi:hypothetical protein